MPQPIPLKPILPTGNVSPKKTCPIIMVPYALMSGPPANPQMAAQVAHFDCMEKKCAFWDESESACSILSLAKSLKRTAKAAEEETYTTTVE